MLRKLRIVLSVVCGIVCMLLIALWVRSYWCGDVVNYRRTNSTDYAVVARQGLLQFANASECFARLNSPLPVGWNGEKWYLGGRRLAWLGNTWGESPEPEPPLLVRAFPAFDRPNPNQVRVPIWFLVLVSGALTAAPWFRWRFSLRTLLVVVTLVAVGLGAIVYLAR